MVDEDENADQGIRINGVSFYYPQSSHPILDDISLNIPKSDFLAIMGANGSGKTTLIHTLNAIIPHEIQGKFSGEIVVDGVSTAKRSVSYMASRIGIVFQNPDNMIFNLSVYEEVEFGLKNLGHKDYAHKISDSLRLVGLEGYENMDPHLLSFGQKQKLCIACAMAVETPYLVLDEPSAMLDYQSSIDIYNLLTDLNSRGVTIITVEHNSRLVAKYAKNVAVLDSGKVTLTGNRQDVFAQKEKMSLLGLEVIST
jgi:energy-coupling factor transporter ATP-binding protein EcfA2